MRRLGKKENANHFGLSIRALNESDKHRVERNKSHREGRARAYVPQSGAF